MTDRTIAIAQALTETTKVVVEYRGSDAMNSMNNMLEALAESYRHRLADVSVDELIRVQSCLKQVKAIQGVLAGSGTLPVI